MEIHKIPQLRKFSEPLYNELVNEIKDYKTCIVWKGHIYIKINKYSGHIYNMKISFKPYH